MIYRLLNPLKTRSFFLFGACGTGKTTWLKGEFTREEFLYIDLLDNEKFDHYLMRPEMLHHQLEDLKTKKKLPLFVIIDEVQKVPALLDIAQRWIQQEKLKFVFTGSSARKLKRGHGNMLGGRANTYSLHPLCMQELGEAFDLQLVLQWGSLPEILECQSDREKTAYLNSYCNTYLKEEVLVEQLIRKIPPFKNFMSLLAQNNGKLINLQNYAREIGVDHKTVNSYLEILEETFLGILLRPHHPSLRKGQLLHPKFYFFDLGVKRCLDKSYSTSIRTGTSEYGQLFKSFIINEIYRINEYNELGWTLGFYLSKSGAEIDLILSKGRRLIMLEIKSANKIDVKRVFEFERLSSFDKKSTERKFYISQDKVAQQIDSVECIFYSEFLLNLLPNLK